MKGLHSDEAEILGQAATAHDPECYEELWPYEPHELEIANRLRDRGLIESRVIYIDDGSWAEIDEITALGRTALKIHDALSCELVK